MKIERTRKGRLKLRMSARLYAAQNGRCYLCGAVMTVEEATHDHVVPRVLGGKGKRNIALAHFACNTAKGGREPTADELSKAKQIMRVASQVRRQTILNALESRL